MIEAGHGNLLEANVEALVNTVNTVGVMGRGIGLQFKKAFPENFIAYERLQARRGGDRPRVDIRTCIVARPSIHHQLPNQEALAAAIEA